MKVIAIMSPKGGIGKTTTSDTIAYLLGQVHNRRVLILDGDPQGDTSKTYGVYEPEGTGMMELLEKHVCIGGEYTTEQLIQKTPYSNIDIIPANGYLQLTTINLLQKTEGNPTGVLKNILSEQHTTDVYDYCICDCGRLMDAVVINILISADMVIAPVKIGGYENEALITLQEQLVDIKEQNPQLKLKALLTMRQKNKTSLEYEQALRQFSGCEVFKTPVRRSVVVEKSQMAMAPLPDYSKNGITVQDYRAVTEELIQDLQRQEG